MRNFTAFCVALLALTSWSSYADTPSDTSAEQQITATLHAFMEGASINSAEIHDAFWAEELVYTSSVGKRFGKAQLMQGVHATGEITERPLTSYYRAEDIAIKLIDGVAIVNFTLVAYSQGEAETSRAQLFNTGVFIQRDGRWQAINWNATRAETP